MELDINEIERLTSQHLMSLPTFREFTWEMFGIDTIAF